MIQIEPLKIAHISPFAPNRCGLYEASRDMARADMQAGNEVFFFDAGIMINDKREPSQVGAVDDRAGFRIITAHPDLLDDMDVIIMHTGFYDGYLVRNQAPLIWMVHGKPLDCFRPEQNGLRNSYTTYKHVAEWKRTKKMIYFWIYITI